MSIGKKFLAAVLNEGSVAAFMGHGAISHLFRGTEVDPYAFVREFVKEYGSIPTVETVFAHTDETLPTAAEPAAYYLDLLNARHVEFELKKTMQSANSFLQPDNKNPEEALKVLMAGMMSLVAQKNGKQIHDFRAAYDAIWADYLLKWDLKGDHGLQFGWPTLDGMTGGLIAGDMVSFIGRPAAGKTFQLLYGAHHDWAKAGKTPDPNKNTSRMFVSMEMGILPIQQRLAAMHAHVPMTKLQKGRLTTTWAKSLKKGLTEIKAYGEPFYVIDGNLTATVEDIWMLARQLKPGAIFIDGGYLVKHPTERDRYRRVAENAELMKTELAAIAPVVCSWQFAKTASKKDKKKGEKVTLDDIGYTDAIAQVSSLVLGIFENETVETIKQRTIEILKGRAGEVGSFKTRWDFDVMRFDEIVAQDTEDLQFI